MVFSGVIRPLFPFPALATWHLPAAMDRAIETAERKVRERSRRTVRIVAQVGSSAGCREYRQGTTRRRISI
jgi:hypothetical protein